MWPGRSSALQGSSHPRRRQWLKVTASLAVVAGMLALVSVILFPTANLGFLVGSWGRPIAGVEPSATAAYLRGQQMYDAKLVWEAYSDRVVQDLQERGDSVERTQQWLDRLRDMGIRIEQVQYVGGTPVPGGSMQFYLVARTSRAQEDPRARFVRVGFERAGLEQSDVTYVPYVFTLDAKGKIDRVE